MIGNQLQILPIVSKEYRKLENKKQQKQCNKKQANKKNQKKIARCIYWYFKACIFKYEFVVQLEGKKHRSKTKLTFSKACSCFLFDSPIASCITEKPSL